MWEKPIKALPEKLRPENIKARTRPARKAIRKGFALLAKPQRVKRIKNECGSKAMWDIDFAGKCMEKLQDEYNRKNEDFLNQINEKLSQGWEKRTVGVMPEIFVIANTREDSQGEVWVYFNPKDTMFPWELQLIKTDIFKFEEDLKNTIEDYEKTLKKESRLRKWMSIVIQVVLALTGVGAIVSVALGAIEGIYSYRIASAKNKAAKQALEIQKREEIEALKRMEAKEKSEGLSYEEKTMLNKKIKEIVEDNQKINKGWIGKALVVMGWGSMLL